MPRDPIYCYCPEGGGLLHMHRNPPYDTEGRLELHRKAQEERVVEPKRLPPFEDEGSESDPPLSPNEQERLRNASTRMEICDVELRRGDCENENCSDENGHARQATLRVGRYNLCVACADERDRGKPPLVVEPRIKLEDLK
jgi:hypothetical protein